MACQVGVKDMVKILLTHPDMWELTLKIVTVRALKIVFQEDLRTQ
ncbi:hypothetical protein [Wolbachia pipientis]